jgi:hypothetical protein
VLLRVLSAIKKLAEVVNMVEVNLVGGKTGVGNAGLVIAEKELIMVWSGAVEQEDAFGLGLEEVSGLAWEMVFG